MSATLKELELFYWYCHVCAQVVTGLPSNEATRAMSRHAVRMATLNFAGKHGIRIATADAHRIQKETGKPWSKCGLLREHAIPVSEIHKRVLVEVRKATTTADMKEAARLLEEDMLKSGLDRQVVDEFPANSMAWPVVQVVRRLTNLCWVSADDDKRLREKPINGGNSLHKAMPLDWDGSSPFARYETCGIKFSNIDAS